MHHSLHLQWYSWISGTLGLDSMARRFCESQFPATCKNASLSQILTDLQQLSQNWQKCGSCCRICAPLNPAQVHCYLFNTHGLFYYYSGCSLTYYLWTTNQWKKPKINEILKGGCNSTKFCSLQSSKSPARLSVFARRMSCDLLPPTPAPPPTCIHPSVDWR